MSTALVTLANQLAERFGLVADPELLSTLKATAFKSKEPVSDAQMTALLIIATQYGLNPWTKELYAYPDERKGIVPVVGVDGWIRIVNEHPQFDGCEFSEDVEAGAMTCTIYRKDRSRPTVVTEYFSECSRKTDPWSNMPRRMMRHKAFIQCARLAFGFALYDDEEGATAAAGTTIDAATGLVIDQPRGPQRKSAKPAVMVDSDTGEITVTAGETGQASAPAPDSPPAPPPVASAQGGISAGSVAYLRGKLKAAGVDESSIQDRFQVSGIELLTAEQFDALKSELLKMT